MVPVCWCQPQYHHVETPLALPVLPRNVPGKLSSWVHWSSEEASVGEDELQVCFQPLNLGEMHSYRKTTKRKYLKVKSTGLEQTICSILMFLLHLSNDFLMLLKIKTFMMPICYLWSQFCYPETDKTPITRQQVKAGRHDSYFSAIFLRNKGEECGFSGLQPGAGRCNPASGGWSEGDGWGRECPADRKSVV